jgi:uncharacterized repeat protein (TIGR01451 family)
MKNLLLFLILSMGILLVPAALAVDYGEFLFSGEYQPGDLLEVDGHSYVTGVSSDKQTLRLIEGTQGYHIDAGECMQVDKTAICFFGAAEYTDYWLSSISVYRKQPAISFSRILNVTEGYHSTPYSGSITIYNNGSDAVSNVHLVAPFPPGTEVLSLDNPCEVSDTDIVWSGSIAAGEVKICDYELQFTEVGTTTLSALLNYTYEGGSVSLYGKSISLAIEPTIAAEVDFVTKSSKTGKTIPQESVGNLTINLTNAVDEDTDVAFMLVVPTAMEIVNRRQFRLVDEESDNRYYLWEKEIDADGHEDTTLKIKAVEAGDVVIRWYGNYTFDGKKYQVALTKKEIEVTSNITTIINQNGSLRTSINTSPSSVELGEKFTLSYRIQNTNPILKADAIRSYLYINDEVVQSSSYTTLRPLESIRVKYFDIYAQEPEPMTFNALAAYGQKANIRVEVNAIFNGSTISIQNTSNVTIGKSPLLKLEGTFSNAKPQEGELVQYTIEIENPKEADVYNLSVQEDLPEGIKVISGITSRRILIPSQHIATAYSYLFYANGSYTGKPFQTRTTMDFYGKNESVIYTKKFNITRTPTKFNLTQEISGNKTWLGEVVPITYTLENKEGNPVSDVEVYMRADNGVGMTMQNFTRRTILPGEKVTLTNYIHVMQPGSIAIPPVSFFYTLDGKRYIKQSKAASLSVNASRKIGPLLSAMLDTSYEPAIGRYTYWLDVANDGVASAIATWHNVSMAIAADNNERRKIVLKKDIRDNFTLSYTFLGKNFMMRPEIKEMTIIQPQHATPEKQAPRYQQQGTGGEASSANDSLSVHVTDMSNGGLWTTLIFVGLGVFLLIGAAVGGLAYLHFRKGSHLSPQLETYLTEEDKKSNVQKLAEGINIKEEDVGKVSFEQKKGE